eukprot:scaffold20215_cov191-Skeletonema_marinoi.AAC.5
MAAESRAHLYKDIPTNWDQLKNNIWLSDAGALPVIFVLTFACGLGATFIGYNCVANPDVRITTSKRQQLIRTWERRYWRNIPHAGETNKDEFNDAMEI